MCNHEYRIIPKDYKDTSVNERFFCTKCLLIIFMNFQVNPPRKDVIREGDYEKSN